MNSKPTAKRKWSESATDTATTVAIVLAILKLSHDITFSWSQVLVWVVCYWVAAAVLHVLYVGLVGTVQGQ